MNHQNKENLHEAVFSGNMTTVQKILQRNPSCVNHWNLEFRTPLHMVYHPVYFYNPATADERLPIMQLLIEYGVDVNMRGGYIHLETALHMVVKKKQIRGTRCLLENKADPNIMNVCNETALHRAAFVNDARIIKLLLDHKADPNIVDYRDRTPLDVSIRNDKWNSVKILLDFRAKSKNIYECLLHVCKNSLNQLAKKKLIDRILRHSTEIDSHGKFSLEALFDYILSEKHNFLNAEDHKTCILLEILDEKGVRLHDIMGKPDLHLAVCEGEEAVVEALLREGADVNARDVFFETPLHLLSMNKKPSRIARLLVKYGADLRARNCMDETPFFLAVRKRNMKLVNLILAKITGVDETTLMCSYPTALPLLYVCSYYELIVAIALRYEQVIHRLLEMDYIVEKNTNHCQDINRALKEAVFTRQYDIINILLESGFQTDRRFPHDVPRFSAVYQTGCNLRTVCLFREFQDSAMIGQATIDIIDKVLERRPIVNELTNLLVFYYAMDLHLNKVNVDLIPLEGLFESCKELSEILDDCSDQLSGLKTFKVESKSLYDIVLMQQGSLVKLLNNENYVDACVRVLSFLQEKKILQYYQYIVIEARIYTAIEKMEVLKMAKDNLNEALQGVLSTVDFVNLPDKITMKILTHLHMRELKKIAETSEVYFNY